MGTSSLQPVLNFASTHTARTHTRSHYVTLNRHNRHVRRHRLHHPEIQHVLQPHPPPRPSLYRRPRRKTPRPIHSLRPFLHRPPDARPSRRRPHQPPFSDLL